MIYEGNTVVFEDQDLTSLDNIPDWLTAYIEIDSATGLIQAFNGSSKIPLIAGKHLIYIKLLDSPPITDIADADRVLQELDIDGSIVSSTTLQEI